MAGYPYTGGVYGGYKDPANAKKKTFIGPDADQAVKDSLNPLGANVKGAYNKFNQGVQDTLNRTSEAYKQGGLGSAAGQYVRGTVADAGNALVQGVGKPLMAGVVKPALSLSGGVANFAKTLITGDATPVGSPQQKPQSFSSSENTQPNSLARQAIAGQPPKVALNTPQQFKTVLKGGITYEGGDNGQRTFTMGTPGQDGYGKIVVHPTNQTARNMLARPPQQSDNGYTVDGPESAVSAFNAPLRSTIMRRTVGLEPTSIEDSHQTWLQHSGQVGNPMSQMPRYLTPEEGAAQGLGWKGRLAKYKADMDLYERATGNKTSYAIAQMQEAGAGRRAILQAQGVNDANDIARQRLGGDLALNQARIGSEQVNQQKGQLELGMAQRIQFLADRMESSTDPLERRAIRGQILALQGKSDNPRYQIVTKEEADPLNPGYTVKTHYAVDPETRETFEIGGGEKLYPLPPDRKQLVKGRIYQTPAGVGQWDGHGFDRTWYNSRGDQPNPLAAPVQPSTGQLMP